MRSTLAVATDSRARGAMALLWLLLSLVWAPAVFAQTEGEISVARRYYKEGLAAEKEERWQEALTAYEKALEIRNTPQLALRAGVCHEELGQLAEALVVYERAQEKARLEGLDKVGQVVGERLEALRPRVPHVIIDAQDAPEGLVVTIDGNAVAAATFGAELPLNPGDHVVRAEAPAHEPFERRVTLEEGAEETVAVSLTPDPDAAPVTAPADASPPASPEARDRPDGPEDEASYLPAGLLLGGGGALVVVGAVLLGVTASKEADVDDRCGGPERLTCPLSQQPDIESTLDQASTFRIAGFVVGGVGAAALVAGAVFAVLPPVSSSEAASVRFTPVAGLPLSLGLGGEF